MLRQIAFLISFLIFTPAAGSAQCSGPGILDALSLTDRAALEDEVAATPFGEGLLWSATRGDQTAYIIGTMHLPDPRHTYLLQRFSPLIEASNLLLVEATLDDQAAMQLHMSRNPQMMSLPADTSLPALLGEERWNAVKAAAEERGLPGFMVAKMQPWFLTMTLSLPPCAMTTMASGALGLDGMLVTEAEAIGVPVRALEDWQDMLALLSSGTLEEQLTALEMGLIDLSVQRAIINTLLEDYFAGNTARAWLLTAYLDDFATGLSAEAYAEQFALMTEQLLDNRNRAWIPVIEAAAEEAQTISLAFGAAHLIGDKGVLALLQAEGWAIQPLR